MVHHQKLELSFLSAIFLPLLRSSRLVSYILLLLILLFQYRFLSIFLNLQYHHTEMEKLFDLSFWNTIWIQTRQKMPFEFIFPSDRLYQSATHDIHNCDFSFFEAALAILIEIAFASPPDLANFTILDQG